MRVQLNTFVGRHFIFYKYVKLLHIKIADLTPAIKSQPQINCVPACMDQIHIKIARSDSSASYYIGYRVVSVRIVKGSPKAITKEKSLTSGL